MLDFEIIQKIKKFLWVRKLKKYYDKYERFLMPAALLVGVIIDALTFRNIEVSSAFSLLTFYLVLSGVTIAFVHGYKEKIFPEYKIFKLIYTYAPVIIQFTFGALLSAIFIFYFFSGAVMVSWPLFLLLVFLMVANDKFREYYLKAEVQLTIYYFILLLFLILTTPFLFNEIGVWVFLVAGVTSLILFIGFLFLLARYSATIELKKIRISALAIVLFALMNIFYFTNIIPPIPLSVRDSGIYYSVERIGNKYEVIAERDSWREYFSFGNQVSFTDNSEIFVYTSVFAPVEFREQIIHEWKYYNKKHNSWITTDRSDFVILGGSKGGYRGYSLKRNIHEGEWRVEVETESGKVLDVIEFELVKTEEDNIKTEVKYK